MPLRYSKDRMKILKSVAALQRRGALDETLYRNFLRWYGKALRELQRLEDKLLLARAVPDAPPSVVDLLSNSEQRSDEWLQQPGQHSFNDEMNGISPEERQRLDATDK